MRPSCEPDPSAIRQHLWFVAQNHIGSSDRIRLFCRYPGEDGFAAAAQFRLDQLHLATEFAAAQNRAGLNVSIAQSPSPASLLRWIRRPPKCCRAGAFAVTLDAEKSGIDIDATVRRLSPSFVAMQRSFRPSYAHLTWRFWHRYNGAANWMDAQGRLLMRLGLPALEPGAFEPVRLAGSWRYAPADGPQAGEPEQVVAVLGPRSPQNISEIFAQVGGFGP